MPRTNEEIDKFNEVRKINGLELLAYETEGNSGEKSDEEKKKIADDAEVERLRVEAENKAKENSGGEENKTVITATETTKELSKEEQEAIVKKYLGITDLNEVVKKSDIVKEPTSEEIEKAKEQRENEKIAYALKTGKVNRKQYEGFIADSKDPVNLVLAQYSKEQKELDPTLTDDDIEAEFNSKFGLDQEQDSRKHKRGLKEINLLAENILKNSYGSIYQIDSEFDAYENQQLTQKQLSEKLLKDAPIYKQTVEDIYAGLKKIPIKMDTGESYEVEMPDEIINSMKERELNTEYAASQIKNGFTKESKAEAAKLAIIWENLPKIIQSVADKINYKRQAGTKGIPPLDGQQAAPPLKKLTKEQQESVDRIYGRVPTPIAN